MKLSEYAKKLGVSYCTAHRLWKAGKLDAYQLPTGTGIVQEPTNPLQKVAVYARVSSAKMKGNLDTSITVIVVEHKDRATRFGLQSIETLLEQQERRMEIVNQAENGKEDVMTDVVSIMYRFRARLYGPRRAKQKTEQAIEELTKEESESTLDATGGTTPD